MLARPCPPTAYTHR